MSEQDGPDTRAHNIGRCELVSVGQETLYEQHAAGLRKQIDELVEENELLRVIEKEFRARLHAANGYPRCLKKLDAYRKKAKSKS